MKKQLINFMHEWWPLIFVLIIVSISFFYGWLFDESTPRAGAGWADQDLYHEYTGYLRNFSAPGLEEVHYAYGYPFLGLITSIFLPSDPFLLVSLGLFIASITFVFIGSKAIVGRSWTIVYLATLLYWDGVGRSFHYFSEIFANPWNNQLLVFSMAYIFWLFTTKLNAKDSTFRLLLITAVVFGITIATREETVVFLVPILLIYGYLTRQNLVNMLKATFMILIIFLPQIIIKTHVVNSAPSDGIARRNYASIAGGYLEPDRFVRNVGEVLIDSERYEEKMNRKALFQEAPWLYLFVPGAIFILFRKKYPVGLRWFAAFSAGVMVFYLSGHNMAAFKLQYHTLRYITPSYIFLVFAVTITIKELIDGLIQIGHKAIDKAG